jgi:hypothetical protein
VILNFVAAVSPDQRFVKDRLFCIDCEIDTVDLWFGTGPVELFELLNLNRLIGRVK